MTAQEILDTTDCGVEIAEEASEHELVVTLIEDNGLLGDLRIALYRVGDVEAICTNGPTFWSEGDPREWAAALEDLRK